MPGQSLANFAHFFVGTLVLARVELAQGAGQAAVAVLLGYTVFAILFGWLVFGATGLRKSQSAAEPSRE